MESQPAILIAHLLPKILAILGYFLLSHFSHDLLSFIIVLLIGAIDFWIVKNVSGRKLLALRWWTDVDQQGDETWVFQSQERQNNSIDVNIFWFSQAINFLLWIILALLNLLNIFWLILNLMMATLSGSNLIGYYKCKGEHQNRLKAMAEEVGVAGANRYIN